MIHYSAPPFSGVGLVNTYKQRTPVTIKLLTVLALLSFILVASVSEGSSIRTIEVDFERVAASRIRSGLHLSLFTNRLLTFKFMHIFSPVKVSRASHFTFQTLLQILFYLLLFKHRARF